MRWGLVLIAATMALAELAWAETPADVLELFRQAADALANDDSDTFLAKFDRNMAGYAAFRDEIAGLLAAHDVGSTIEVVNDEGDDQKRSLDLDWLLVISEKNSVNGTKETRRRVLKCRIERQGKQWRIVALEPVEFFRD
jgi:hypothetical protein